MHYCETISLGLHRVWRLPTVTELNSIKLHAAGIKGGERACYPAIDQRAFPDTATGPFWTSTVRSEGEALYVGFDDGCDHSALIETPMNVRCVTDA